MKVAVTFPLYLSTEEHKKYLDLTTQSISSVKNQIYVIPVQNYISSNFLPLEYKLSNSSPTLAVKEGRQPQSVAKGWNSGIQEAKRLGCDYVLVINADIVLKPNTIDKLVAFGEMHPEIALWSAAQWSDQDTLGNAPEDDNISEHPNFSCYMVRPDFLDKFGKFDENIYPAYFEDNDMHARLVLAGERAVVWGGARFWHAGSRTSAGDPNFARNLPPYFNLNAQYFKDKWGTTPVNEVEEMKKVYWKHPYNDPLCSLKYWRPINGQS